MRTLGFFVLVVVAIGSLVSTSVAQEDHLPGPAAEVPNVTAPVCGAKQHCGDMTTCAEAYFYMTSCGLSDLDRDADGIPCEKTCGKTLATMQARIKAQPYASIVGAAPSAAQALIGGAGRASSVEPAVTFDCKAQKTTCKQMLSCEEATFYLQTCGATRLDGNHDGIPCNGLCR